MFQELIERAYGKMYKIAYLIASPCKKNPPLFLTDAINKEHMLKCHVQKLQVTWCLQKKKNGGGGKSSICHKFYKFPGLGKKRNPMTCTI